MKFRGLIILLTGLLILAGCATLNKEECLRGDWYGLGMRDGVDGEPAARIEKHRKACAEYGVQPDERRYLDGRIEGLHEYCQIGNAFRTGLDGKRYQGVCPPAIDALFWRYNEAAYAVHQTQEEIKQLNSELSSREIQLRSKKTTDKERSYLREEIRDRDRKLDDLRFNLRNQERRLDDLMEEARQGRGVRR